jgi:hypothetical protein
MALEMVDNEPGAEEPGSEGEVGPEAELEAAVAAAEVEPVVVDK